MATIVQTAAGAPAEAAASPLRYVARQPILDLRGRVYGYELLFRTGPQAVFGGDGEQATRTMIDNTVIFGLDMLTGGAPAFVNCTADALHEDLAGLLPPGMTVLEVLETVAPTPGVVKACIRLKSLGFRLALDDFTWSDEMQPLIAIADYIKIDFLAMTGPERRAMLERLKDYPVALLAEKVETQEDYRQACAEGFTLFQGYYFCRPTLLTRRKIPPNRVHHIELLQMLREDPLDVPRISEAVKREPALMYRLLRLVNSPASAIRQEVSSIAAALLAVGDCVFRRVAMVAIASEMNAGQPAEILRMGFVRARFCELASALCGMDETEQYLLGMFSLLPAMLRISMSEVLAMLPLRQQIRKAMAGERNRERLLLDWLEANEQAAWPQCDEIAEGLGIDRGTLHACFTTAMVWAERTLTEADPRAAAASRP